MKQANCNTWTGSFSSPLQSSHVPNWRSFLYYQQLQTCGILVTYEPKAFVQKRATIFVAVLLPINS
eukprot:m.20670 g.20670  ORF g.20670 m.20670 type:complete len:66 (+) comp12530_c0_seq1:285-482(+)